MSRISISLILLVSCSICLGRQVDQSQTQYHTENDWNSGIAQTITAGSSGYLMSVDLVLKRNNGTRDLTVEIKHIDGADAPTGPVLASGTLGGSAFVEDVTQWYSIPLDEPYLQTAGEKLAIVVQYGAAGDPYGWHNLAHTLTNLYPNGLMYYNGYYGPESQTYDEGNLDMAFKTVVSELALQIPASNAVGIVPFETVLTASVLGTNNESEIFFSWDVDNDGVPDGEGLGLNPFTNTYTTAGVYSVSVLISNSLGNTDSVTNNDCITVQPVDLVIDFQSSITNGMNPLSVVFATSVSGVHETNLNNFFYSWDIDDDGTPDAEGVGLHLLTNEYQQAGVYSVSLTVTNIEDSATLAKEDLIRVLEQPDVYVSIGGAHVPPYTNWLEAATNIQAALDAASDGDSILISNGLYTGEGNIGIDFRGKNVSLQSLAGRDDTIIDCASSGPGFYFHSGETSDSVLSGFTVQNCGVFFEGGDRAHPNTITGVSSAVICESNSSPRIADCRLIDNHADKGGGIYIESSSPIIDGCLISANYAEWGGGIYCANSAPVITNSIIEQSDSYYLVNSSPTVSRSILGGGIYSCSNSDVYVADSLIADNRGGGIYSDSSTLSVVDSDLCRNKPGGEYLYLDADPTIIEQKLGVGSGVYLISSTAQLHRVTFSGNTASSGAAVHCDTGSVTMTDCELYTNKNDAILTTLFINAAPIEIQQFQFGGLPGVVHIASSSAYVTNCEFRGNLAMSGGAIGASNSFLSVADSYFSNNEARESKDITTHDITADPVEIFQVSTRVLGHGGAVYLNDSVSGLTNCVFDSNVAGGGGAIAVANGSTQNIWNCVFSNNAAMSAMSSSSNGVRRNVGGGALFSSASSMNVYESDFFGSSSGVINFWRTTLSIPEYSLTNSGTVLAGAGGAMAFTSNSVVSISDCDFIDSRTGGEGGVLYLSETSVVSMTGCLVQDALFLGHNISETNATRGGAFYIEKSDVTLNACAVLGCGGEYGGGVYCTNGTITLYNSTICENAGLLQAGGILMDNSQAHIVNSIVWDNVGSASEGINGGTITGTNSYVRGGINGEPDPPDPELRYGYRLFADSPCIDAAISSNLPAADVNGDAPWDDPSVNNPPPATIQDIGADEFIDSDSDRMDDSWEYYAFTDLSHSTGTDADSDGLNDVEEYDFNTSSFMTNTDFDCHSDYQEWIAGVAGDDGQRYFKVDSSSNSITGFVLNWDSVAGRVYGVLSKTNFSGQSWVTNASGILGDDTQKAYTNAYDNRYRYFRINVTKP